MTDTLIRLTEAEFDAQYTTMDPPSGEAYWEFDELPSIPEYIWTVVESDTGDALYLLNGYHLVNRIGYLVTSEHWTEDTEVLWLDFNEYS